MRKYGMADVMMAVITIYLANHLQGVSKEQRDEIEQKCYAEILTKFPSARELEVGK